MGLSFRCPRSRLLKLLLFQSGLFLSVALYLYCSSTTTTTMGEPFPEIKSTHSLVAKYVTKPLWDKLSSVKTATSGFTLAKVEKLPNEKFQQKIETYFFFQAIACAVQFDDQHCGIYAGDWDSYKDFAEVFDPLIQVRTMTMTNS